MAVKITKENIDELITSYLDDRTDDPQTKEQIAKMIENDEVLKKKYKSEILTRDIFKSRLKSVDVPEQTYLRITGSIDAFIRSARGIQKSPAGETPEISSFAQYLKNFFVTPLRFGSAAVPRYAVALVLISSVFFIGILVSRGNHTPINPYIASGSDKSIMVQAVNNFHKIQSGEVKPEMHSGDAKEVSNYLKQKLSFEPVVPGLSDFELLGCVCNKFSGDNIAHIVYGSGNNIIYVYQTDMSSIKQKKLELPGPVYDQMVKEKYYMCDHVDDANCTLLLWYINNVLCASVSNISKNNLYSKFITTR